MVGFAIDLPLRLVVCGALTISKMIPTYEHSFLPLHITVTPANLHIYSKSPCNSSEPESIGLPGDSFKAEKSKLGIDGSFGVPLNYPYNNESDLQNSLDLPSFDRKIKNLQLLDNFEPNRSKSEDPDPEFEPVILRETDIRVKKFCESNRTEQSDIDTIASHNEDSIDEPLLLPYPYPSTPKNIKQISQNFSPSPKKYLSPAKPNTCDILINRSPAKKLNLKLRQCKDPRSLVEGDLPMDEFSSADISRNEECFDSKEFSESDKSLIEIFDITRYDRLEENEQSPGTNPHSSPKMFLVTEDQTLNLQGYSSNSPETKMDEVYSRPASSSVDEKLAKKQLPTVKEVNEKYNSFVSSNQDQTKFNSYISSNQDLSNQRIETEESVKTDDSFVGGFINIPNTKSNQSTSRNDVISPKVFSSRDLMSEWELGLSSNVQQSQDGDLPSFSKNAIYGPCGNFPVIDEIPQKKKKKEKPPTSRTGHFLKQGTIDIYSSNKSKSGEGFGKPRSKSQTGRDKRQLSTERSSQPPSTNSKPNGEFVLTIAKKQLIERLRRRSSKKSDEEELADYPHRIQDEINVDKKVFKKKSTKKLLKNLELLMSQKENEQDGQEVQKLKSMLSMRQNFKRKYSISKNNPYNQKIPIDLINQENQIEEIRYDNEEFLKKQEKKFKSISNIYSNPRSRPSTRSPKMRYSNKTVEPSKRLSPSKSETFMSKINNLL